MLKVILLEEYERIFLENKKLEKRMDEYYEKIKIQDRLKLFNVEKINLQERLLNNQGIKLLKRDHEMKKIQEDFDLYKKENEDFKKNFNQLKNEFKNNSEEVR